MVDNIAIALVIGYVLNYLILYKKNKFYGAIVFVMLGIATVEVTDSNVGAILLFLAILITFFESNNLLQKWMEGKKDDSQW